MNKNAMDRHGQPLVTARHRLGLSGCRRPFVLRMVRGIFVVKWLIKDIYGNDRPAYSALGPKGRLIYGIGGRQETITAAGGRMN